MLLSITHIIYVGGLCGVIVFHWRARSLFARQDAIIQKYKLFKVRDDLIYLVAAEHLSENDFVFEYFYNAINFLIQHTEMITLKSFVSSLRQARNNGLDPSADQELKKIQSALNSVDEQGRLFVQNFFGTMTRLLIENSRVLRIAIRYPKLRTACARVFSFLRILRNQSTEREAYSFYEDYRHAAMATA